MSWLNSRYAARTGSRADQSAVSNAFGRAKRFLNVDRGNPDRRHRTLLSYAALPSLPAPGLPLHRRSDEHRAHPGELERPRARAALSPHIAPVGACFPTAPARREPCGRPDPQ